MTAEDKRAIVDWLNELAEVMEHRGRHEGHTTSKFGRCVICSCGFRYQA